MLSYDSSCFQLSFTYHATIIVLSWNPIYASCFTEIYDLLSAK